MILTKEAIIQQLDSLDATELQQVAEYLVFLRFQALQRSVQNLKEEQMAKLYAEFAEEDRQLAEDGIADYQQIYHNTACNTAYYEYTPSHLALLCRYTQRRGGLR